MVYRAEEKFTVCSFFAGGGLLDLAFKNEFKIIWANELYEQPALSYFHDIGNHIRKMVFVRLNEAELAA